MKVAEILGIGKTAVGRFLKGGGISTLRHVKTTQRAEIYWARRWRLAGENLHLYAGGVRAKRIFPSGEAWADKETCRRVYPQND